MGFRRLPDSPNDQSDAQAAAKSDASDLEVRLAKTIDELAAFQAQAAGIGASDQARSRAAKMIEAARVALGRRLWALVALAIFSIVAAVMATYLLVVGRYFG